MEPLSMANSMCVGSCPEKRPTAPRCLVGAACKVSHTDVTTCSLDFDNDYAGLLVTRISTRTLKRNACVTQKPEYVLAPGLAPPVKPCELGHEV
ncbi:hypothetical protein MRX96_054360 [Rhipicephalus microplus]